MKKNKFKIGLTIEYVMISMTILVAFVVLIFTTMMLDSTKSGEFRKYLEQKQFVDQVAHEFVSDWQYSNSSDVVTKYMDNEFKLSLSDTNSTDNVKTLIIKKDGYFILKAELKKDSFEHFVLTCYEYGSV